MCPCAWDYNTSSLQPSVSFLLSNQSAPWGSILLISTANRHWWRDCDPLHTPVTLVNSKMTQCANSSQFNFSPPINKDHALTDWAEMINIMWVTNIFIYLISQDQTRRTIVSEERMLTICVITTHAIFLNDCILKLTKCFICVQYKKVIYDMIRSNYKNIKFHSNEPNLLWISFCQEIFNPLMTAGHIILMNIFHLMKMIPAHS